MRRHRPSGPHLPASCTSILILLVCTSTNGFFSFLTRAGELTSGIRLSISNETVRRDIHHPRAPGGRAVSHPFSTNSAARQVLRVHKTPCGPSDFSVTYHPAQKCRGECEGFREQFSTEAPRCLKCRQGSGTLHLLCPAPPPAQNGMVGGSIHRETIRTG